MIMFRKHISSFVDVREPVPVQQFPSLEALLNSLQSSISGHQFSHWAASNSGTIMGVWDDGVHWWVMGRTDADISSLPKWEPKTPATKAG